MSFCAVFLAFGLSLVVVLSPSLRQNEVASQPAWQDVTDIKVELQAAETEKEKIPRFTRNVRLKVILTNNSSGLLRALILDTYYQNRPKLYKKEQLVPYRTEIAKRVTSKDNDPQFVRLGSFITLYPTKARPVQDLDLADWYDKLEPGIYRITNRYRREIHGKWSSRSEPLEFEVVAEQK